MWRKFLGISEAKEKKRDSARVNREPRVITSEETLSAFQVLNKFLGVLSNGSEELVGYMSQHEGFNPEAFATYLRHDVELLNKWKLEKFKLNEIGDFIRDVLQGEFILKGNAQYQNSIKEIIELVVEKIALGDWYSQLENEEDTKYRMSPDVFSLIENTYVLRENLRQRLSVLSADFNGKIDSLIDEKDIEPSRKIRFKKVLSDELGVTRATFMDRMNSISPASGPMLLHYSIVIFDIRLKDLVRVHGDPMSKKIDVIRAANQLLAITELILNNETLERFDRAAERDLAFSDRGVAIQFSMTVLVYYVMVEAVYNTVSEVFTINSYN